MADEAQEAGNRAIQLWRDGQRAEAMSVMKALLRALVPASHPLDAACVRGNLGTFRSAVASQLADQEGRRRWQEKAKRAFDRAIATAEAISDEEFRFRDRGRLCWLYGRHATCCRQLASSLLRDQGPSEDEGPLGQDDGDQIMARAAVGSEQRQRATDLFEVAASSLGKALRLEPQPLVRARTLSLLSVLYATEADKLGPVLPLYEQAWQCLQDACKWIVAEAWPSAAPPDPSRPPANLTARNLAEALADVEPKKRSDILDQAIFLVRKLAQVCRRVGDPQRARWFVQRLSELLELKAFYVPDDGPGTDRERVLLRLEKGLLAEDIDSELAAVELDQVVCKHWTALVGNDAQAIRSRVRRANLLLARLYRHAHANRSARFFQDAAAAISDRRVENRPSGPDPTRAREQAPEGDLDDHDGPAAAGAASPRDGAPDPSDDRLADIRRWVGQVQKAIENRNPYAAARCLDRLAKRLADGDELDADIGDTVARTIASAESWRPKRRGDRRELRDACPPGPQVVRWSYDAAVQALELVENYAPGLRPRILKRIAEIQERHASDAASATYREAGQLAEEHRQWWRAAESWMGVAQLDAKNGLPDSVKTAAQRAAQCVRRVLDWLGPGYEQATALQHWEKELVRIARLLIEAGAPPDVTFAAIEACKGQTLAYARDSRDVEGSLLPLEEMSWWTRLASGQASEEERQELLRRIDESRATIMEQRLQQRREGKTDIRLWHNFDRAELDALLKAGVLGDAAIIQYFCDDQGSVWAAIVRSGPEGPFDTPVVPLGPIAAQIGKRRRHVWDDLRGGTFGEHQLKNLRELHHLLIEPLLPHLTGVSALYVVPHKELVGLPLHALRGTDKKYLIELFDIAYAPSVRLLTHVLRETPAAGDLLVLGWDQIIDAPGEVRSVSSVLQPVFGARGYAPLPMDEREGVQQLLDRQGSWAVIHVIAHGDATSSDPMSHEVRFVSERITAADMLQRGARAQLFFANTCDLGTSREIGGDLYGFEYAVLASGSLSAVVAPMRLRPDHAHEFAKRFYRRLASDTCPKVRTFRETARELIDEHRNDDGAPSAWAPYHFVGDPRPISWPEHRSPRSAAVDHVDARSRVA